MQTIVSPFDLYFWSNSIFFNGLWIFDPTRERKFSVHWNKRVMLLHSRWSDLVTFAVWMKQFITHSHPTYQSIPVLLLTSTPYAMAGLSSSRILLAFVSHSHIHSYIFTVDHKTLGTITSKQVRNHPCQFFPLITKVGRLAKKETRSPESDLGLPLFRLIRTFGYRSIWFVCGGWRIV